MTFTAAASLLMLLAGSAAERPAGVPDWHASANRGPPGEGEFMEGYADCVVHGWADKAQELLATLPDSPEQTAAVERLDEAGQCLHSGWVQFWVFQLRGAIAEMLMRRSRMPASFKAPVPAGQSYQRFTGTLIAAHTKTPNARSREMIRMRWFGYCAVERNRSGVEALLATKVHSKQEVLALDALSPTLADCTSAAGALHATVPQMRALIAEPLYWRRAAEASPHA
jgi:hypothetical protein